METGLTDLKTGTVVLYFDAATLLLATATFTAEQGSASISGIIEVPKNVRFFQNLIEDFSAEMI